MTSAVLFMGDLVIVGRQLRLIVETHRRGLTPLLVVTPHTDPARLAALRTEPDHPLSLLGDVVMVPEATVEQVVPAIQPLLRRYDVRAILCIGDLFAEPAGLVAECLGLPGPGATTSRICRNKVLQRTALPELSPAWRPVPPDQRAQPDVAGLAFPVVVKPAARFSSLGVRRVVQAADLPAILAGYPPGETVLVEELVEGPEFSVEALSRDGTVCWAGVTAKNTNESTGTYFAEMGHITPAPIPDAQAEILTGANAVALRRLGMRDGISHLEFRLCEGRPVLMEAAARLPGGAITFLWELATGRSLEPAMIDLALGLPTAYPAARRRAGQVFLDHPYGRLRDVTSPAPVSWVERDARWPRLEPTGPQAPPRALAVLVTRLAGEILGPQRDNEARSVSVVFDAPLDEPIPPLAAKLAADVAITVDQA
jgi:hypothetical protein